jgi:hypothetical protein
MPKHGHEQSTERGFVELLDYDSRRAHMDPHGGFVGRLVSEG